MKYISLSLVFIFIFTACSGRQYYEPKDSDFFYPQKITVAPAYIKSINPYGATLDTNQILTKDGISRQKLPKNYSYLNNIDNTLIASDNQTNLLLMNSDTNETIDLKRNAVAASKKDSLLALVFDDNSIGIYDTSKEKFVFKEYAQHSYFNDTRIAAPIILKNIILFPTLDGKIIIVDKNKYTIIRTITIDPNSEVNNVILLHAVADTLIAATQNKIISIKDGQTKSLEFFTQNYFISKDGLIYVAKLDGTIAVYDANLNELHSKKFKFAKFLTINIDNNQNIYALELGGYLVKITQDFSKTIVYRFPLEDDEKIFAMKNRVYLENKILYLDTNNSK